MEENKEQMTQPHKRRVRYKGTHPRRFEEKYKELNPEKYGDTIEHVIQKGGTPAGMHISIMVKEILDFLQIQPGQKGLDATLGYGGHTRAMLEQLKGQGHIYGLDVDPIESVKTKKRLADLGYGEEIMTVRQMNFADIDKLAEETGLFDFVLADLGVSSMQIDNPERGFSYKADGPLDLRLNPEAGISAAERLKTIDREELAGMLRENSDEPYAEEIARTITGEVLCEDIDRTAVNRTATGYHAVTGIVFLLHAEVGATVFDKHVHLLEAAFVQQHGNTFTGCIFTFLMLFGNGLLATAHTSRCAAVDEFFDFFQLVTHVFYLFLELSSLYHSGFSQSSVSTPSVDFGWRNAMLRPSAPLRGALSMRRMPSASTVAKAWATPSSTAKARWCMPPLPLFFSMNLAMVLSGEVGSRSSIFTSPTRRKAVLTF